MGRILLALAVGALLAACGDGDTTARDQPEDDPTIRAGEYVVTDLTEAGEPRATVPGSEIRIRFEDGALRLNAGCNHLFGDYTLVGDRLTVGQVGGTEMGCPPPLMDQDAWLADVLQRPITVGTDPLTLTAGDVVLTLTPREEVSPDRPLVGTTWTLDGLIDGKTASSLPMGVEPPTLRLEADGSATFHTGCNGAGARYEVQGDQVTWIDPVQTLIACQDARGELERHVTAVLDGPTAWSIKERRLTITKGGKGLMYVARR